MQAVVVQGGPGAMSPAGSADSGAPPLAGDPTPRRRSGRRVSTANATSPAVVPRPNASPIPTRCPRSAATAATSAPAPPVASACDAPVCFLTGQRDRVIGFASLSGTLGSFEDATYTSICSAGHYLPLEQAVLFAAVTRSWLAQCQAAETRREETKKMR